MPTSTLERQLQPHTIPWEQPQEEVPPHAATPDRERSILASKTFWLGGCLSIAIWTGVVLALLR